MCGPRLDCLTALVGAVLATYGGWFVPFLISFIRLALWRGTNTKLRQAKRK